MSDNEIQENRERVEGDTPARSAIPSDSSKSTGADEPLPRADKVVSVIPAGNISSGTASSGSHAERKATNGKRPSFLTDLRDNKRFRPQSAPVQKQQKSSPPSDIKSISADDLKDPDWMVKHVADITESRSAEGTQTSESNSEVPAGGKKHSVNWLAMNARQRSSELLGKSTSHKERKANLTMKYGW